MLEDENAALRKFKNEAFAKAARADARAGASAAVLPRTIGKALQSQLVYTGRHLKRKRQSISYTCDGVDRAVFEKAFNVGSGTTTARMSGSALGVQGKWLRYGALLDLVGDVTVQLSDDGTLFARASYSMC